MFKINQFGQEMATAIETPVTLWRCSVCGHLSYGKDGNPPVRCSNRKGCGKLFHGVQLHEEE